MIKDSSKLVKGQKLQVNLGEIKDRLPKKSLDKIKLNDIGTLVGYKMVDGNQFGFALKFGNEDIIWFFENELSELPENLSSDS